MVALKFQVENIFPEIFTRVVRGGIKYQFINSLYRTEIPIQLTIYGWNGGGGLDIYSNFRFISSSIKLENVKFTRNISS